jgi:hypothetical protein
MAAATSLRPTHAVVLGEYGRPLTVRVLTGADHVPVDLADEVGGRGAGAIRRTGRCPAAAQTLHSRDDLLSPFQPADGQAVWAAAWRRTDE